MITCTGPTLVVFKSVALGLTSYLSPECYRLYPEGMIVGERPGVLRAAAEGDGLDYEMTPVPYLAELPLELDKIRSS